MIPKKDEGDKTQRVKLKQDIEKIQKMERGIIRGFRHSKNLHQQKLETQKNKMKNQLEGGKNEVMKGK